MSVVRVAFIAMGLAGCSLSYVDQSGNRHVVGLVDISVHPPADPSRVAGDVINLTTIGLSISDSEQGSRIGLGYNHDVIAALRDNSLVLGNPLALTDDKGLRPSAKGGKE